MLSLLLSTLNSAHKHVDVLSLDLLVKCQLCCQGKCVSQNVFLVFTNAVKARKYRTVQMYVSLCSGSTESASLSYGPLSWPRGCKTQLGTGSRPSVAAAINIYIIPVGPSAIVNVLEKRVRMRRMEEKLT